MGLNQPLDKRLLEQLERLVANVSHGDRHFELCSFASDFCQSYAHDLLKQIIATTSNDIWIRIQHFLGRLRYWHKAATWLVCKAPEFASLLGNSQFQKIPSIEFGDRHYPKLDEDLERLVWRAFPNYRGTTLCSALVDRMKQSEALRDWFRLHTLETRPHAEMLVLDHFFFHNLSFVGEDRYIACSKSSCYCCSLCLRLHPGRFEPRPTHGNVWIQWCLPRPLRGATDGSIATSLTILRRMANATRQSTHAAITNNTTFLRAMFESTTGLSTSASGQDF